MSARPIEDRARDRLEGRLSAEEAALLEELVVADPVEADRLSAYEVAYRGTAPLAAAAPACPVGREAIPTGRSRPQVPYVRVAAAVLVAALGALAFLLVPRTSATETVRLAAIPLEPPAAPTVQEALRDVPLTLASYRPTADGTVRWLSDESEARMLARWTGRPVLHYQALRVCPICRRMEQVTFADPDVQALLAAYVPFREELSGRSPDELGEILRQGWPRFASETPGGRVLARMDGYREAPDFAAELQKDEPRTPTADWTRFGEWLDDLAAARSRLDAGAYGEAWRALEAARSKALVEPRWLAVVQALEAGVARSASERLAAARDADAPLRILEDAATRFEGSPFAQDFRSIAARVRERGRVPELVETAR